MSQQTIADDLKAARALLEKGWCQNALERHGSYCALGAIYKATVDDAYGEWNVRSHESVAVVMRLLRESIGSPSIAWFNNAETTTQQDVLNLFDKALAELGALA